MSIPSSRALTIKSTGLSYTLVTTISLASPDFPNETFDTCAIWDTGATCSVISTRVVDALKLSTNGFIRVNTTSHQNVLQPVFLVDIILQSGACISGVLASLGYLTDDIDVLVGMDVITQGDFSVTNFNGNTCMSFRVPSMHQVDYVEDY